MPIKDDELYDLLPHDRRIRYDSYDDYMRPLNEGTNPVYIDATDEERDMFMDGFFTWYFNNHIAREDAIPFPVFIAGMQVRVANSKES